MSKEISVFEILARFMIAMCIFFTLIVTFSGSALVLDQAMVEQGMTAQEKQSIQAAGGMALLGVLFLWGYAVKYIYLIPLVRK